MVLVWEINRRLSVKGKSAANRYICRPSVQLRLVKISVDLYTNFSVEVRQEIDGHRLGGNF